MSSSQPSIMISISGEAATYLNRTTHEKVFCILGPEYGPELVGRVALVVKSFYGLKTSCTRWNEHIGDNLHTWGWFRSKAFNDVWIQVPHNIFR